MPVSGSVYIASADSAVDDSDDVIDSDVGAVDKCA
jgi:hypothetical protein